MVPRRTCHICYVYAAPQFAWRYCPSSRPAACNDDERTPEVTCDAWCCLLMHACHQEGMLMLQLPSQGGGATEEHACTFSTGVPARTGKEGPATAPPHMRMHLGQGHYECPRKGEGAKPPSQRYSWAAILLHRHTALMSCSMSLPPSGWRGQLSTRALPCSASKAPPNGMTVCWS